MVSLSLLLSLSYFKPLFFPALPVFSRDVDINYLYSTLFLAIYFLVAAFTLLLNLFSQKIWKSSY